MAWFKIDDGLHSSRKFLSIPRRYRFAAIGVWTVAGSWCADQLTDGAVPDYMLAEWNVPPAAPAALVDAGLWERTSDGYEFHKWHEYQPRKEDVDAERAASRERMRELRARRKQSKPQDSADSGEVFGRTGANGSENVRNPDPTRPDPTPSSTKKGGAAKRGTRIPEPFMLTSDMRKWAMEEVPTVDTESATKRFVDYWRAESGAKATKVDWVATWRNWMRKQREFEKRDAPAERKVKRFVAHPD